MNGEKFDLRAPWQPCSARGWSSQQFKRCFSITLGKTLQNGPLSSSDIEVPYLKAQHVQWDGVRLSDLPTMWALPSEVKSLQVSKGDLLVCEGGEVGRASIVTEEPPVHTIIQNALHLVRGSKKGEPRFLLYLLRHAATQGWFDVLCNKSTITHFTVDKFRGMWASLPELSQQNVIADFLDRETSNIDTLISSKELLLDLLAERCLTLIARVVTHGLDPDIPMSDSGIPHIGEIPAHWSILKLKWIASLMSGKLITSDSISNEGEYPVFGGNGLRGFTTTYTHNGDHILIGRQGALCGNINYATGRFWASEHAIVVTVGKGHEIKWLGKLLEIMNLNQYSQSAAQQGLAIEFIANISLPVPPNLEQRAIVSFIQDEMGRIEAIIARTKQTIKLLRDRRAALIAAAVTGKIDIGGSA